MRSPERIDVILEEFRKLWKSVPDVRFGQLVVNIVGIDPFYIEDDDFLSYLKSFTDRVNCAIQKRLVLPNMSCGPLLEEGDI